VSGTAYRVENGARGYIEVFSAGLGQAFTAISPSTESPGNRSFFTVLPFTATRFLLLGGEAPLIEFFEIWQFDVSDSSWSEFSDTSGHKLPARSGHCSTLVSSQVYVIGGFENLNPSSQLLILALSPPHFSPSIFSWEATWPPRRSFASLTTCCNKIRLFGGIAPDSTVLADLWEVDASIFQRCPIWHLLANSGPPERFQHTAWFSRSTGDFYIAGGFTKKTIRTSDVWKFTDYAWTHVTVFSDVAVFASELGLLTMDPILAPVEQRSPFSGLNNLFEEVRQGERAFSRRCARDDEELQVLKGRLDLLKTSGVCSTRGEVAKLEGFREDLLGIVKDLATAFPGRLKKRWGIKQRTRMLPEKFEQKLARITRRDDTEGVQHQALLSLFRAQERFLSEKVSDVVEVDPSDFSTFEKFLAHSQSAPAQAQSALTDFYAMQLRAHQRISARLASMKHKIQKSEANIPSLTTTIARLSSSVQKGYVAMGAGEAQIDKWTAIFEKAERDKKTAERYLKTLREIHNGETLQSPSHSEKPRECDKARHTQEALTIILKQAEELRHGIKGKAVDQVGPLVAQTIRSIKTYLEAVSWHYV
jgi:hypothetical protein